MNPYPGRTGRGGVPHIPRYRTVLSRFLTNRMNTPPPVRGAFQGRRAAEAVKCNNFSSPFFSRYEKYWKKALGSKFKSTLQIKEMLDNLPDDDVKNIKEALQEGDVRELIEKGRIKSKYLSNIDILSSQENLNHLQNLLKPQTTPQSFSEQQILDKQLDNTYTRLKNKYYQKFRENLTIAQSQSEVAKSIIATELLLEQRPLTQKEIEQATNFQRSTISDSLKLLLEMNMIQLMKKPHDRKKYYIAVQSWDTRTINRFKLNIC